MDMDRKGEKNKKKVSIIIKKLFFRIFSDLVHFWFQRRFISGLNVVRFWFILGSLNLYWFNFGSNEGLF